MPRTVEELANLAAEEQEWHIARWMIAKENIKLENLLHTCVEQGNLPMAQWFVSQGAKLVSESGYYKASLFEKAARHGHLHILEWLQEKHPLSCQDSVRVFEEAIEHGQIKAAQWILDRGVEIDPERILYLLYVALQGGHVESICWLEETFGAYGLSLENVRKRGGVDYDVALASLKGHVSLVEWLVLQRGAVLHPLNPVFYRAPLCLAAREGHLNVVQWMITHGVDVGYRDQEALLAAVKEAYRSTNRMKIVQLLVAHGADLTARQNEPLVIASRTRNLFLLQWIVSQKGVDVFAFEERVLKECTIWCSKWTISSIPLISQSIFYWLAWFIAPRLPVSAIPQQGGEHAFRRVPANIWRNKLLCLLFARLWRTRTRKRGLILKMWILRWLGRPPCLYSPRGGVLFRRARLRFEARVRQFSAFSPNPTVEDVKSPLRDPGVDDRVEANASVHPN